MNSCILDYSELKTRDDLLGWVDTRFPLKNPKRKEKAFSDDAGAFQIWDYLVENEIKEFEILESYSSHASPDLKRILGSWRSILGFHLYRDNLISLKFSPNPQTKGKKPKS